MHDKYIYPRKMPIYLILMIVEFNIRYELHLAKNIRREYLEICI